MAVALNCNNFVGRQFSIGKRRSDSRRSCFQYLLSIPPSFAHALFNSEVCARRSYGTGIEGACVSIGHKIKDVRVEKFARARDELELAAVNLSLIYGRVLIGTLYITRMHYIKNILNIEKY